MIEKTADLNEVREAYADHWLGWDSGADRRQLQYRASFSLSPEVARKAMLLACVYVYNAFTPDVLDKFDKDCRVTIAREGSVCLYVRPGASGRMPCAKAVGADEVRAQDNGEVRYWWD